MYIHVYACLYVCTYMYRCLGRLKEDNSSPGAGVTRFVSYTRELGLEFWSSIRAAYTFSHLSALGIAN